jgi:hypothetical protein
VQIEDSAFSPVRYFMAEYTVAAWRDAQDGSPILFGGRRRGHDVRDGDMLIDAKVLVPTSRGERHEWPGHDWKFFRDRHALFNPAKTTHIAFVLFPKDLALDVEDDGGERLMIRASPKGTAIFLVQVEEINDLLNPEKAQRKKWQWLLLETAWLNQHQVR